MIVFESLIHSNSFAELMQDRAHIMRLLSIRLNRKWRMEKSKHIIQNRNITHTEMAMHAALVWITLKFDLDFILFIPTI